MPGLYFQWSPLPWPMSPSCSPGIFRFRSQMLPTVATDGARLVRVMLSLTLPSPLIFTVNGLPARTEKAQVCSPEPRHRIYRKPKHWEGRGEGTATYRAHAHQRIWWRQCKPQARWGSRRPCRCHLPGPPSGCPLCWGLPRPKICHHNLQHNSPGLLWQQLIRKKELGACGKDISPWKFKLLFPESKKKVTVAPDGESQREEQVKGSEKSHSEVTCWMWLWPQNSFLKDIYYYPTGHLSCRTHGGGQCPHASKNSMHWLVGLLPATGLKISIFKLPRISSQRPLRQQIWRFNNMRNQQGTSAHQD